MTRAAHEHRALAELHLAELADVESTVLVATPVVFSVGLALLAVFFALLRSYQRRMDEMLRHEAAAVRRSERRCRALVQHASDVTLIGHCTGRIRYHSPTGERLWGYSPTAFRDRAAGEQRPSSSPSASPRGFEGPRALEPPEARPDPAQHLHSHRRGERPLIRPLGQWVREAACRQVRTWQEQFPSEPPLILSVKLSPRQFQEPKLLEDVERALRKTGLPPGTLMLEITEGTLRELGCRRARATCSPGHSRPNGSAPSSRGRHASPGRIRRFFGRAPNPRGRACAQASSSRISSTT